MRAKAVAIARVIFMVGYLDEESTKIDFMTLVWEVSGRRTSKIARSPARFADLRRRARRVWVAHSLVAYSTLFDFSDTFSFFQIGSA